MILHKLIKYSAPAALFLAAGMAGHASMIVGSFPLNGGGLTQDGANLGVSTMVSATLLTNLGAGAGDYAFIPASTDFGGATLDYSSTAALAGFSFSSPLWGTFTAQANPANAIVQKTANFLDVFIVGTFTPGTSAGWTGKDPTESSLRFSINQSGASISEAITLNSPALPPPGVPEPGTMVLYGSALVAVSLLSKRRLAR